MTCPLAAGFRLSARLHYRRPLSESRDSTFDHARHAGRAEHDRPRLPQYRSAVVSAGRTAGSSSPCGGAYVVALRPRCPSVAELPEELGSGPSRVSLGIRPSPQMTAWAAASVSRDAR